MGGQETSGGPALSIVVLTGGRSSRMGRDKATSTIGGIALLDRLLADLPAAARVIVSGPPPREPGRILTVVREHPPGGGPVAGIAAAMREVKSPVVGVVAVDMPWSAGLIAAMADELLSAGPQAEAIIPDVSGRRQPLCAVYRTAALQRALCELGTANGRSMRELVALLRPTGVTLSAGDPRVMDVDTPAELAAARNLHRAGSPYATMEHSSWKEPLMQKWVTALCGALGVADDVDVDLILDVAKDAAHGVERPAAPISTYLVGYAVGLGANPKTAAETVRRLAAEWSPEA